MDNLVPVSEAKARLSELVRDSEDHDVYLMRHGRVAAILISPARLEALTEEIEDLKDRLSIHESRTSEPGMRIPLDKLEAELGLIG